MKINTNFLKLFLLCYLASLSSTRLLTNKSAFHGKAQYSYKNLFAMSTSQCGIDEFDKVIPDTGRYVVETHNVTTDDGYILQMFRVNLTQDEKEKLPDVDKANISRPVMVQHGLFSDATSMFDKESNSFPFYMVNKGFDVWLGNNRGSKFSLSHVDQQISEEKFYDYSFTEMGLFDMPVFYKYILEQYTEDPDKKIIYFGHSEGTSQMFASLTDPSTKDYMRKHTERFFALSPIVYMTSITNLALDWVSKIETTIEFATDILHVWQIGSINCDFLTPQWAATSKLTCSKINFLCNHYDLNIDNLRYNFGWDLSNSGASIKQLTHYGQLINGGSSKEPIFRPYDYGTDLNNQKYGQDLPPEWKFDDFETKLTFVVGKDDGLGNDASVQILQGKLPTNLEYTKDVIDGWDHNTVLGPDDPTILFNIINKALNLST